MKSDLHIHTNASDGQYSPDETVKMAKFAGLECIAITDHDTLDGLSEAEAAGEKYGIKVLRGVELGAAEHRHLHILGLGFGKNSSVLGILCQKLKDSRDERKFRIISFLKEKGIEISLEDVEKIAGGQIIARPHFARVMVERGYVKNTREAFEKYLDTDEYQRIERFKASAEECISAIHSADGKAVMAHPYQLGLSDDDLEKNIVRLCGYGLDGIECYYPKHSEKQIDFYLKLAKKYGLMITNGSDFHGEKVKPDIKMTAKEINISLLFPEDKK